MGEVAIVVLTVYTLGIVVRHFWRTRRQPVRDDAPTGGPWVRPRPRR